MRKTSPNHAEINKIARKFIRLRNKLEKNNTPENQKVFADYKNYVADRLSHLVTMKSNRYRKFPNHSDLVQEGFEALFLALNTYVPKKGSFAWWSRKYIDTRISRAANAHSTIRYPIKKAKETQPYKVHKIPPQVDTKEISSQILEAKEYSVLVKEAIEQLDDQHKQIILWAYGFMNNPNTSVSFLCKQFGLSRLIISRLLKEAETQLREIILLATNEPDIAC